MTSPIDKERKKRRKRRKWRGGKGGGGGLVGTNQLKRESNRAPINHAAFVSFMASPGEWVRNGTEIERNDLALFKRGRQGCC